MPLFQKPNHFARILRADMDSDDTSRDRALAEQGIERIPTRDLPRMKAMAEIKVNRDMTVEEQLAAQGVDDPTKGITAAPPPPDVDRIEAGTPPPPAPTRAPSTSKADPSTIAAQFGDEPVPLEALDGLKVKVKVDGVLKELTVAELRRTVQLDGAAFNRLQEATDLLNKAKAMQPGDNPGGSPPAGDDKGKPGSETPPRDQSVNALVTALFAGDTDAATSALGNLLSPQQAQVDPAQIARTVKQQLSTEEAIEEFKGSYSDVASDPFLASIADRFFEQAQAADPQKSFADLLTEAGEATRKWVKGAAGAGTTERSDAKPEGKKLKDKSLIDNVSGVGGRNANPEPAVQSRSDVIANMRKARGLE
jgi:hypothetical protein